MASSALVTARATAHTNTRFNPHASASGSDRVVSHSHASGRGVEPLLMRGNRVTNRVCFGRRGVAKRGGRVKANAATSDPRATGDLNSAESSASGEPSTQNDWSHVTPDWLYRSIESDLRYFDDFERYEIAAALETAFKAHDGQKRKSGEPFITHPVAVAQILGQQKMDHETVMAGLLHDTVEDTDFVTFESIEERFGPAVRRIVEGETKVSKVSSSVSKKKTADEEAGGGGQGVASNGQPTPPPPPQNVQADDLREMFLAMTQEVRVIIVKLADRLHNMRTLGSLKPEKRVKISRETLLVFAPLAKLLGMYQVKNELEDLAFKWSLPDAHAEAGRRLDELSKQQEPTVKKCAEELQKLCDTDLFLTQSCAKVTVIPRAKELYGVYRKSLKGKGSDGDDVSKNLKVVNEVAQLRVVLDLDPTSSEPGTANGNGVGTRVCYHVLGLVHERWPPVPGRMNDYIATPKLNGYRALHTVVLPLRDDTEKSGGNKDRVDHDEQNSQDQVFPIELQIRTGAMHRMAESGIAADPEVKGAWRATARRTARKLKRMREEEDENDEKNSDADDASDTSTSDLVTFPKNSVDFDSDSDEEDELLSAEDSVLIRSGHARQVAWLSNIREWQEEFLGVLTAEEFVDTVTGDLLGRRVFVFTPSGGVMNLPHGATVVDFAFYTDRGLDAVKCSVNGVPTDFDRVLRNADVVEIITEKEHENSGDGKKSTEKKNSTTYGMELSSGDGSIDLEDTLGGLELTSGAGEASAAAIASAVRKHRVSTQKRFLEIAKTRSTRAKIKKFLAENGGLHDSPESDDTDQDKDIIDTGVVTQEVTAAAGLLLRELNASTDSSKTCFGLRKLSEARISLRCEDKDGLLREISSVLSATDGCSIVGYAGESVGKGEFLMTYTIVLDARGDAGSLVSKNEKQDGAGDSNKHLSLQAAESTVMDFDTRLSSLFSALQSHDRVIDARVFCKREQGVNHPF
tara:strand:- start:281 stop:3196 length:2916 start_codon:yes stop_codon:yes gene_type:complete